MQIENLDGHYKYTFKYNSITSYVCLASKIHKKNIILGFTGCGLYVPLPFWFCKNSDIGLPIGFIGGEYFDLRQPPVKVTIDFNNLRDLQIINK